MDGSLERLIEEKLQHRKSEIFHEFETNLGISKTKWLQMMIALTELKSTDSRIQSSEVAQMKEKIRDNLLRYESKEVAGCNSNLLGIKNSTSTQPKRVSDTQVDSEEVTLVLEERLRQKLIDISEFYQPSPTGSGEMLKKAKSLLLTQKVKQDIEMIEKTRDKIKSMKSEDCHKMKVLIQTHQSSLEYLNKIIDYKITKQPDLDKTQCQLMQAEAVATQAKLRLMEAELLDETYNEKTIPQLKEMRTSLNQKIDILTVKLKKAESAYKSCLSEGSEFEQIARQYGRVKKDIEDRQWAIDELTRAREAAGMK